MQTPETQEQLAKIVAQEMLHEKKQAVNPLDNLDQQTLFTAASVVSQVGFSHFELGKDSRLNLESRKAHTFVAMNCEDMCRKILRLRGAEEPDVENQLMQIAAQVKAFREQVKAKLKLAPVSPGKIM